MAFSVTIPGPTSGNSFNLNFTNGDNAAIAQAIALNIQIPSTDYITNPGTSFVPNTTTYVADDSSGQSFVVAGSGTYNFVGGDGNLTVWEGPGGNASVAAGNGNDLLGFNAGSSYVVAAGNGNDTFVANGSGTIYTGIGNNLIFSDPAGPNGNFIFSHGHDTISAATGPTTVATYGYAPEIFGGSGSLLVYGNSAIAETVAAGSGATTIFSATSGTYFMGTGNTNEFIGSPGSASTVVGSTGSETVFGGPNGSEDVFANSSSLIFAGSSGDSATITGGTSQVTLFGAAGSAETLLGSSGSFFAAGGGNETLNASGSSGNNLMFAGESSVGGAPNTYMAGGSGNDTLVAGSGANTLAGGAGNNLFQFTKGFVGGTDIISDFTNNDVVNLFGYGTAAGANALAAATVSGGSTTIALSDNTKITFSGITNTGSIHITST